MRRLALFSAFLLVALSLHITPHAGSENRPMYFFSHGTLYAQESRGSDWIPLQPDRENLVFNVLMTSQHYPLFGDHETILMGRIDDGTQNFVFASPKYDWYNKTGFKLRTYEFPNAYLGYSHYYNSSDNIVFSAILELDPITGRPTKNRAAVYMIHLDYPPLQISPYFNITQTDAHFYCLPEIVSFAHPWTGFPVQLSVIPVEGGRMHFIEGRLTEWSNNPQDLELVIPDETFQDRDGLYALVNGLLYPLDIRGRVVNHATAANGKFSVYISLDEDVIVNSQERHNEYVGQWIHIVQNHPLTVIERAYWGGNFYTANHSGHFLSPFYNRYIASGDIAVAPDNQTILFTSYDQQIGASVWKMYVHMPERHPELLVSGLNFKRDGKDLILPQFTNLTDESFTLEITGFRGTERRTYTYDGALVSIETTPDNPIFYIRDRLLYVYDGTDEKSVEGALEGQRYTFYKPSDGNGWGLAIGYLDDSTENFTLSLIEQTLDGFTQRTKHYPNLRLLMLPLSTGNGVFYDNLDNYLWLAGTTTPDNYRATVYFLEGLRDIKLITDLFYQVNSEDGHYFPYLFQFTGEMFHIATVEISKGGFLYDIPTQNTLRYHLYPPRPTLVPTLAP